MKTVANLTLYAPGIVLFDPQTLQAFLERVGDTAGDVFEMLISNPVVGAQAIGEGVVFPIYQIPDDDYSVFLEDGHQPNVGATCHLTYCGAPLHITSGVLIAADLDALIDWDASLFCDYLASYQDRLANSDYLQLPPGRYVCAISGYSNLALPLHPLGYGLRMEAVQQFPLTLPEADFDFSLGSAAPGHSA